MGRNSCPAGTHPAITVWTYGWENQVPGFQLPGKDTFMLVYSGRPENTKLSKTSLLCPIFSEGFGKFHDRLLSQLCLLYMSSFSLFPHKRYVFLRLPAFQKQKHSCIFYRPFGMYKSYIDLSSVFYWTILKFKKWYHRYLMFRAVRGSKTLVW